MSRAEQATVDAEAALSAAKTNGDPATVEAASRKALDAYNQERDCRTEYASTTQGRADLVARYRAAKPGSSERAVLTRLIAEGDEMRGRQDRDAAAARGARWVPTERKVTDRIEKAHPGVRLDVTMGPGGYRVLHSIKVDESARGTGKGRAAMDALVAEADRRGWPLALSPTSDWGSSKSRLERWYGEYGFTANKGRGRDMTTMETMLRPIR